MNAITQTEARTVNTAAAIPLEAADPTKNLILVPLSRLVLRPTGHNVRKTPRMSIPELAASIQRVGLLQNLIVIASANGEHYEVVAGGRRLAALKLLAKKHRISKEWEVPCLLVADGTARTASLTENVQREAMHPADQFEAFVALVAEGRPIEDIAADFSVTPLVVQRRLKLANVSPRLMADYRADAVSLDQLMALSITDDHAAQESVFYDAPQWQRHPSHLRERLNKVRAHRVLVVIQSAGDGLAAPLAVATQWRAGRRKEFIPRGICAAEGKLFSLDGCSHEARGAAAPPPGFTTTQGRLGPNRSERGWGRLGIPARRLHRPAH